MPRIIRTALFALTLSAFLLPLGSCVDTPTEAEEGCGMHNGNPLFLGPQEGCYYYNSNGNKTYVERSECNC